MIKNFAKKIQASIADFKYIDILAVGVIILIGCIVRITEFGSLPAGLNQDEAFAGYEAYSLLNYGTDSWGYTNPCYFVSWGSGMNVLESYLAMPFIALFGLSVETFRMPQLICACLSLPVFYLLLKEMFNKKIAIIGLFVLSVSPWHIMLSRWGLESNLAPAFLLFGLYFFVKGLKNNRYWIMSALMYGAALYSYSITWAVVPATVVLLGLYVLFSKHKISWRSTMLSVFVLFVMALPLLLFVLVNKDIIPEIRTEYISIPKLLVMRDYDIALSNLKNSENWKNFFNLYMGQNDGLIWNSTEDFRMFYKISTPFIALGFISLAVGACEKFRKRKFSFEFVVIIGTVSSMLTCVMLTHVNVNRINSIHIYTAILLAYGLYTFWELGRAASKVRLVAKTVFVLSLFVMTFSFYSFTKYYFNEYNNEISYTFNQGLEESVEYVNEKGYKAVYVDSDAYFPQILFFDKTPTPKYLETVEFSYYPAAFVGVRSFDKYTFGIDYSELGKYDAYIIRSGRTAFLEDAGFSVVNFGEFSVCFLE